MNDKEKAKKFSWRGWTTFVVVISFIVDTLSGIILYISPPGRIAHWTNWNVWGLSKGEWEAIHTIFGYVLLIIVAIHLYYNWKMFWHFIWSKLRKAMNLKREMVASVIICLVIFLGTLFNVPPFSSTMNLGEYFKESWEESKVETPMAHAELLSLEAFAKKISVPLNQIMEALKSKGYKVENARQKLGEVAKINNTSPNTLYEAIKAGGVKPVAPTGVKGTGMGRKTLEAICTEQGWSLDDVLARLKKEGITAKPGDRLKEIASKTGKTPMEIFNVIKGK
ncbi:MAG: DUF4405 domain-containing protein [Deltaproteobacteria bacterium]|nr:DUF4405 domain-containing protein [Deltaproteobacteria bacterium]